MTGEKRLEFWDDRFLRGISAKTMAKRPVDIIIWKIQHDKGELSFDETLEKFSAKCNLPPENLKNILGGRIPWSFEVNQILKGCNWSIFFLYGISERAYESREGAFFQEVDITSPNPEQRKAFKKIYEICLTSLTQEEGGK